MAATSTQATETEDDGKKHYDKFLDDPYNMAMYVVLPTMVFIYGGCCFIYCMAKCHRYCRRKARRRARQQLIEKDDNNGDSDDGNDINKKKKGGHINAVCKETGTISVVDLTDSEPVKAPPPITAPKPAPRPAPKPTAPYLALTPTAPNPATPKPVAPYTPRTERANASSRVPSSGFEPGYTKANPYGGDLQQQMQHLDNQLKAAFKLISDEPKKVKSRPDVCAKSDENQKPVKKRAGSKMRFLVSDQ